MGAPGSAATRPNLCTDAECRFNRRGIVHTCGQCSGLADDEDKCACLRGRKK